MDLLEEIFASKIKEEPEDFEEEENPPSDSSPPRHAIQNNPFIEANLSFERAWNEGTRHQFVPPKMSPKSNASSSTGSESETDLYVARAKSVQQRARNPQNSSFYANVPPNPSKTIPQSNASPLVISAFNSLHGFQATSEMKQQAVRANPHSHIPPETQQQARRVGANFEQFTTRDPRLFRDTIPRRRDTISHEPQYAPPVPPPPPTVAVVEKKDAETQTTKNDGNFRLELTSVELMNLTKEQKEYLRGFKKVFNIKDGQELGQIEERLLHRNSSLYFHNKNSNNDRRDSNDNQRTRNEMPPPPKQAKVYYTPPP